MVLEGNISLFDTTSGDLHQWVENVPGTTIPYMAWSPDGRQLAYETNQSGTWGIYIVEGSESGEAMAEAKPLFDSSDADEKHPLWSPDGSRIAYTINNNLQVANPDGSDPHDLGVIIDDDSLTFLWSPDGSRLLYGAKAETGWQVKSVDAASGAISDLASGEGTVYLFNLSSDNVLLLMVENNDGDRILALDVNSGELTDFNVFGYNPRWSPDSSHIAYFTAFDASGTEGYQIALMEAQGKNGTVLNISFKPQLASDIDWSPDGTQLAFTVNATDYEYNFTLHLMDANTGEVQFFKDAYVSLTPSWRPCTLPA